MTRDIRITTSSVLEARPLAQLVQKANEFSSKITFTMDQKKINAKSIMGVMGFGLDTDKVVVVEAQGQDEKQALEAMETFLTRSQV